MTLEKFTLCLPAGMEHMGAAFQEYLNELMAKHEELASTGGAAVDYAAVEQDTGALLNEFLRRFSEGTLATKGGGGTR